MFLLIENPKTCKDCDHVFVLYSSDTVFLFDIDVLRILNFTNPNRALHSETLAEGRSKVKDSKKHDVPVVLREFLSGVKTEGVVSMVKQHTISEWGRQPDTKIQKARATAVEGGGSLKSSGKVSELL